MSVLAFFAWLALACLVAVALFGKEDGSGNTAYAILECALPGIGVMFWVLYLTTTHYERKNWRRTWEERNSG